jgi:hypothetical protein
VGRGLSAIASYTFSKSTQSGVDFYNQFNLGETRGLSLLDQRQRLSVAFVYAPTADFSNATEQSLLKDWKISVISQLAAGHPYTGVIALLNDSAAEQATANTAAGLVGGNSPGYGLAPGDGINSFTGPGIEQTDLGIERAFKLGEKGTVTLKAQVFNLLNAANYYVYAGSGINQVQYTTGGSTCGDGKTLNQVCTLTANNGVGGFQTLTAVDQANPPRIMQFSFGYKF